MERKDTAVHVQRLESQVSLGAVEQWSGGVTLGVFLVWSGSSGLYMPAAILPGQSIHPDNQYLTIRQLRCTL